MNTQISFINFLNIEEVQNFQVINAIPERADGMLGQLPDGRPVWPVYTQEGEGTLWVTAEITQGLDTPNNPPYKFGGGVLRSDWSRGWLNGIEIAQTETRARGITPSANWHLVETAPIGAVYTTLNSGGGESTWRKFADGWAITQFSEEG